MRPGDRSLSFVVNFLLGVAWAAAFIGAVTSFLSYYHDSFFLGIVSAFVGLLPGLVAVLLLEHIITVKESYFELKKQTKILEALRDRKEQND